MRQAEQTPDCHNGLVELQGEQGTVLCSPHRITNPTKEDIMESLIGKTVLIRLCMFEVPMDVLEEKRAYGHTRLLVTPVNGKGEQWVNAEKMVTA